MPRILDGKTVRDQIRAELKPRVAAFRESTGRAPGLVVVLVGNDPASEVYVASKTATADELGIYNETLTYPATTTTDELLAVIARLNERPEVDGILVQLPLPAHVDSQRVLLAVLPEKDVDGFHPCNIGAMVTGRPAPKPCTPAGIIELLKYYQIPVEGKHAVVVGRSDIVGKPMAALLLQQNATVTICHSKTRNLAEICRTADILVGAIGRPAFLKAEHIQPGAVVIDVGVNRVDDYGLAETIFPPERLANFAKKGYLLTGDVNPADMEKLASAYTPVPGGVGPLTIAMLMFNTVGAAERRIAQA